MEELSTSAVRKCCMSSPSWYVTRCCTSWVMYLSVSDQHSQGVSLYNSLLAEGRVMVQRVSWAIQGSDYRLGKGAQCDPQLFTYVFQQNGWGEPVGVSA